MTPQKRTKGHKLYMGSQMEEYGVSKWEIEAHRGYIGLQKVMKGTYGHAGSIWGSQRLGKWTHSSIWRFQGGIYGHMGV